MRTKEALQTRIVQLCRENGLTLNGLADRCGITQSTLNNLIGGRNQSITVSTVKKICDGLNMELPEFFSDPVFLGLEQEIQ